MKFLIVDDNEIFRKYLREFIAGNNDECAELDDGIDVNKIYKSFMPDWVLLDIVMKSVNGFEAAVNLKKEFPAAHIAMVSNYNDDKFQNKAREVGAAVLVSKENLYELIEVIKHN